MQELKSSTYRHISVFSVYIFLCALESSMTYFLLYTSVISETQRTHRWRIDKHPECLLYTKDALVSVTWITRMYRKPEEPVYCEANA